MSKELRDELLKGCERPEDVLGGAGLMKERKIKLMGRMLGAGGRADGASWLSRLQEHPSGSEQPPEWQSRALERMHPIVIFDDLRGKIPAAFPAPIPEAMAQTGIVHLVRPSLTFLSWKDRKVVAADLRRIHSAPTAE